MPGLSKVAQWALPLSVLIATGVFATLFRYEVQTVDFRRVFVLDRWGGTLRLCSFVQGGSVCLPLFSANMEPIEPPKPEEPTRTLLQSLP